MLLGMERAKPNELVYMPGAEPLKCLQKVVGKGYRAVGGGMGVRVFARLGEKNHSTLPPEARCIPEEKAGPVNDAQNMKYIGWKIQEKDRLEAVRTRGLLRLKVRHGIPGENESGIEGPRFPRLDW